MNKLSILSYGDALQEGYYYYHSGFKNIENFSDNKGFIIALTGDKSFLAPNTIVLNNYSTTQHNFFKIENNCLFIDNEKISFTKHLEHHSHFYYPKKSDTDTQTINNIHIFIDNYNAIFPEKCLLFLIKGEVPLSFDTAFEKAFVKQIESAYTLFQSNLFKSIENFKGRGFGLTPSGDDFIAGVLYGINYIEQVFDRNYTDIKKEVFEISKSTNLISNNMLAFASEGKYFLRFQLFLNTFFYLTLNENKMALEQLFEIGNTSGADMLTGFFAVILNKPQILNL